MKKIICLLLSFILTLGMLTTINATEITNAKKYTLGTLVDGDMTKNQALVYKFTLSYSSMIDIDLYSDTPYIYMELFDENGSKLWDKSIYDNDTTKEINYSEELYLCAGRYYIAMTPNASGEYELKINENSIHETFAEKQNGSNNSTRSSSLITSGTNYIGCIALNDTTDIYKFELTASGKMYLNLYSEMSYLYLELFDKDGNRLWSDSIYDNDTTKEIKFQKDFHLCKGIYYFSFKGSSNYGSYEYSFTYTSANESFAESQTSKNNQTSTSNQININQEYLGQIALNDNTDIYNIYFKTTTPKLNINSKNALYLCSVI